VKFTDFISQKMIYWFVIILLLADMAAGSFLNKWKSKTNKDLLKKWAPDLYGAVDINSSKIVNKEMHDILTNPTKNYIRAVLKHHNVCHSLLLDTILDYVGKNPFPLSFVIGELITNDNISVSPDYLYMVTRSKTIKVWLLQRGLCVRSFKPKTDNNLLQNSIRIATSGEFIVSSSKCTVHVWFPQEKTPHEIKPINNPSKALAISSDNLLIASVSNSGSYVRVWDIVNKQTILKWGSNHNYERDPRFGPACEFFCNNSMLCAAQIENNLLIFSVATGEVIYKVWVKNQSPFLFFILLSVKNHIFFATESRHLFILDIEKGLEKDDIKILGRFKRDKKKYFDATESSVILCNTIKTIFLKMEESIGPIIAESGWPARLCTLTPSGRYCALYDYRIKEITIVNVDDLIFSFLKKSALY